MPNFNQENFDRDLAVSTRITAMSMDDFSLVRFSGDLRRNINLLCEDHPHGGRTVDRVVHTLEIQFHVIWQEAMNRGLGSLLLMNG